MEGEREGERVATHGSSSLLLVLLHLGLLSGGSPEIVQCFSLYVHFYKQRNKCFLATHFSYFVGENIPLLLMLFKPMLSLSFLLSGWVVSWCQSFIQPKLTSAHLLSWLSLWIVLVYFQ